MLVTGFKACTVCDCVRICVFEIGVTNVEVCLCLCVCMRACVRACVRS